MSHRRLIVSLPVTPIISSPVRSPGGSAGTVSAPSPTNQARLALPCRSARGTMRWWRSRTRRCLTRIGGRQNWTANGLDLAFAEASLRLFSPSCCSVLLHEPPSRHALGDVNRRPRGQSLVLGRQSHGSTHVKRPTLFDHERMRRIWPSTDQPHRLALAWYGEVPTPRATLPSLPVRSTAKDEPLAVVSLILSAGMHSHQLVFSPWSWFLAGDDRSMVLACTGYGESANESVGEGATEL